MEALQQLRPLGVAPDQPAAAVVGRPIDDRRTARAAPDEDSSTDRRRRALRTSPKD